MNHHDVQRVRIYAAETSLTGRRFASIEEVQDYLKDVLGAHFLPPVRAVDPSEAGVSRRQGCVLFKDGEILVSLPIFARFERYVLHEAAHVLSYVRGESLHGPRFAETYLGLVRTHMGEADYKLLRRKFAEHGVTAGFSPAASA